MSAIVCDLHVHTSNSDGVDAPEALLARAAASGLRTIAIADHSAATWSEDLVAAARRQSLELAFPALEISTMHEGRKYHVLAYGHGVLSEPLRTLAFHPTAVKNRIFADVVAELRADRQLPSLAAIMAGRTPSGAERHPGKWMLGRTVVATALSEYNDLDLDAARRLVTDVYERAKLRYPSRYVDTTAAIETTRSAGCVPVLAHPWWQCLSGLNTVATVADDVQGFTRSGLLGIEVASRHDTAQSEPAARALADEHDLLPFVGSDFHGPGRGELGGVGMTQPDLDAVALLVEATSAPVAVPA